MLLLHGAVGVRLYAACRQVLHVGFIFFLGSGMGARCAAMRWDDEGQSRHASTEKILESIHSSYHSSLALLPDANRTTTQLQTHLVQRSGNPLSFLARSYIYCSDFTVQAHCGWAWLSEQASECRFATAASQLPPGSRSARCCTA